MYVKLNKIVVKATNVSSSKMDFRFHMYVYNRYGHHGISTLANNNYEQSIMRLCMLN